MKIDICVSESTRTSISKEDMVMVTVTKTEASRIIESLAHQMAIKDPNRGRAEMYDERGTYFTIFVDLGAEVKVKKEVQCRCAQTNWCNSLLNSGNYIPNKENKFICPMGHPDLNEIVPKVIVKTEVDE